MNKTELRDGLPGDLLHQEVPALRPAIRVRALSISSPVANANTASEGLPPFGLLVTLGAPAITRQ